MSDDNCMKIELMRWGVHGCARILENIAPRFLREGLTEVRVDAMLRENPNSFTNWRAGRKRGSLTGERGR